MSRPRVPKQTKILRGTFAPSRNPDQEPEPVLETSVRKAPQYLNRYARKLWDELAQDCLDMGTLSTVDWTVFEALCLAWGEYQEMREAIYTVERYGKKHKRSLAEYMAGKNSQTIPEYNAMRKALTDYQKLCALFGIGASNRNKIELKQKKSEPSDTERLLQEGGV